MTDRTSAETLGRHIRGTLLAGGTGPAWKDVLLQVFSRLQIEESVVVPAVAEPLIVWIVSGAAIVEERELGGAWIGSKVKSGDFFLTSSETPYELRWRASGSEPFVVMHLYLGLPILARAARDVVGDVSGAIVKTPGAAIRLREISGAQDSTLSLLLEQLRQEAVAAHAPSAVFIQGIAQSLAVHLVRQYTDTNAVDVASRVALPAIKLRRVIDFMERRIQADFSLSQFAREAGMSDSHFSRLFKKATGYSPSQYFIRLRMAEARRLLRETDRSVIDIGMAVGYASPSHFAQIFRRETGMAPTDYRR